jgi:hypothetical protein
MPAGVDKSAPLMAPSLLMSSVQRIVSAPVR